MEITICYFVIYLVEALIFMLYSDNVFNSKPDFKIKKFIFIFLGYILIFPLSFLRIMGINFLTFISINIILIFCIYESTLFMAIFHSCLLTIVMGLCELIPAFILVNSIYNFNSNLDYFRNSTILAVVSKLLYFIIAIVISTILNKNKDHKSKPHMGEIFLFVIPLFSSFIMMTFFVLGYNMVFPKYIDWFISISSFMILIINICVFGFYNYSKTSQQQFYELQLQLQKESDIAKYNKMLLVQDENQRILVHDIKKHLESISYLNKNNEKDKIESYISHILDSSSLKSTIHLCDNILLNAIIARYINKANDLNIKFHTDIRSKCIDFMSEENITSLFCNLLDNSIEAACKIDNPFIELTIANQDTTPFVLITVVNSCISSPFSSKTGKLITKKSNPFIHGFGVKSINKIVRAYSGEITMYYKDEDHTFHTVIALQK